MDGALGAILVLAALALWWFSATRARELAKSHARRFCQRQEWQLLDQTVALAFMRPTRQTGRWQWRRLYRFGLQPGRRPPQRRRTGAAGKTAWKESTAELDDSTRLVE